MPTGEAASSVVTAVFPDVAAASSAGIDAVPAGDAEAPVAGVSLRVDCAATSKLAVGRRALGAAPTSVAASPSPYLVGNHPIGYQPPTKIGATRCASVPERGAGAVGAALGPVIASPHFHQSSSPRFHLASRAK
jgi:hypothetical protein